MPSDQYFVQGYRGLTGPSNRVWRIGRTQRGDSDGLLLSIRWRKGASP
jgi:hypothetical protein